MKAKDVRIGGVYVAKISGKLTRVRLTGESGRGGWDAVNIATGRAVRIKTVAKLRHEVRAAPIPPRETREFSPDDGEIQTESVI